MSIYKRVHTPNSPLMPLSPMFPSASPNIFLSTTMRRRSFTPSHLNVLPTPSLSPIKAGAPESRSKHTLAVSPTKKSMKKVRSSVRKFEVQNARVPLTPIRRKLFNDSPSITKIESSKSSARLRATPQNKYQSNASPQQYLTPVAHFRSYERQLTPHYHINNGATPGLLEETFTVMSILKEINMQKYANLFVREEVDLFVFLMLNDDDMDELGIDEEDRHILTNAINFYTEFFGNAEKTIM